MDISKRLDDSRLCSGGEVTISEACIFCGSTFSETNIKSNATLFPKNWWINNGSNNSSENHQNLKEIPIGQVCTMCATSWIRELDEHVEHIVTKAYNSDGTDFNLPQSEASVFIKFLLKSYFARMSLEPVSRRHYPQDIVANLRREYFIPSGILLSFGVYENSMTDLDFAQYDAWLDLPGALIISPQERRLKFAFRFNRYVFGIVWLDLSNPIYLISAGFITPVSGVMCRATIADLPMDVILPKELNPICLMLININCIGNTKSTAMDEVWVNEITERHKQLAGLPLRPISKQSLIESIKAGIEASGVDLKNGARLDYYLKMGDSDKLSSREKMVILHEMMRIEVGLSNLASEQKWNSLIQRVINNDSYFPSASSSNTPGRDFGFELYIAGRFSKGGFAVEPLEPDIICTKSNLKFGVAIKRVRSRSQVVRRIKEASQQILKSGLNGIIAVDFSPLIDGYYEKLILRKLIDPMTKIRELQSELVRQISGLRTYCNKHVAGIIGFAMLNVEIVVEIKEREIHSAVEASHGDFVSTTDECRQIWGICRDIFIPADVDASL